MLDLYKDTKDFEQGYFYTQAGEPTFVKTERFGYRKTVWTMKKRDGSVGTFTSVWVWNLQWYYGDCKCDGSRTTNYWDGLLDDGQEPAYVPDKDKFVFTDLPKELAAFRWRSKGPGETHWNNMGGS